MRVVVLGAGISGLCTALSLQDAGCRVRIVAADPTEATTSFVSAAVWFPTHAGPPDRVAAWGRTTFGVLAAQAVERVPGVVMRESLALYRVPPDRPDWAETVDDFRPAAPSELPPGYDHGLRFVVPSVEMPKYLPWLIARFTSRGGQLDRRRVDSLDELADGDTDAVVNCSGLGSRNLLRDNDVHPVRGQVLRVTNPGLSMSVRDEHHPAGRAYVHPRSDDCILGGTLEEHDWNTTPDPETSAAILQRCHDIEPALKEASLIEALVGLRPGRPTVRVELDGARVGRTLVAHNYGHGGSGVTLGWGCAREVTQLLLGA